MPGRCENARFFLGKRLVLTHIGLGEVDEEATVWLLGETYKRDVIVGRDLLETVVPSRQSVLPAAIVTP